MNLPEDLERHLAEREDKMAQAVVPVQVVLEEGMALGYALAVFTRREITLAQLQEVSERIQAARNAVLAVLRRGAGTELH